MFDRHYSDEGIKEWLSDWDKSIHLYVFIEKCMRMCFVQTCSRIRERKEKPKNT
jgi:hypothetical protein